MGESVFFYRLRLIFLPQAGEMWRLFFLLVLKVLCCCCSELFNLIILIMCQDLEARERAAEKVEKKQAKTTLKREVLHFIRLHVLMLQAFNCACMLHLLKCVYFTDRASTR